MDPLGHYIRIHLTGAAVGIQLFDRGSRLLDADARAVVEHIRDELVEEREQLLAMAHRIGVGPAPLATAVAKLGERLSRLKPNGHLLHRTPMTDLMDLEAMGVAAAGKIAGWESLLSVADQHDGLERAELDALLEHARRQHDQLSELHNHAATRALTR